MRKFRQGKIINSVFNTLIMSVCGISKWMPFTSKCTLICNSRERSGLGITDLGDTGDVRTVRVNEIVQGKQSEKNF